jgi:hypothetical protein
MRGRGSTSGAPPEAKRGILVETARFGASLKVTAVDEASGLEVSFVAPASATRADIERLAKAKLRYVLAKKNGGL